MNETKMMKDASNVNTETISKFDDNQNNNNQNNNNQNNNQVSVSKFANKIINKKEKKERRYVSFLVSENTNAMIWAPTLVGKFTSCC